MGDGGTPADLCETQHRDQTMGTKINDPSRSVRQPNRPGNTRLSPSDRGDSFFYVHPQYILFGGQACQQICVGEPPLVIGFIANKNRRRQIQRALNAKFFKPTAYLTLNQKKRLAAWLKQHPPT